MIFTGHPMSRPRIHVVGVPWGRAVSERVLARLTHHLEAVVPTTVRVRVADTNGPKRGMAVRCGISANVPGIPAVYVEALAESARIALDDALGKLERRVARFRATRQARRRQPRPRRDARLVSDNGDSS